jgi:uncharacterized protein HemX
MKKDIPFNVLLLIVVVIAVAAVLYFTIQRQTEMIAQQNKLLQPLAAAASLKVIEYQIAQSKTQLQELKREPIGFKIPNKEETKEA